MFEECFSLRLQNNKEPAMLSESERSSASNRQNHHYGSRSSQMVRDFYGNSGDGVVKVPKIYWEYSSKGVLTMEWIDGIKLTDRDSLLASGFDIQHLVDQVIFVM